MHIHFHRLLASFLEAFPWLRCLPEQDELRNGDTHRSADQAQVAGPNSCWGVAWLIIIQTLTGMIMDAITIGIIFARISHPKYRGRTIAISDSSCIGRRDGILKFMFRIADLRRTQVPSLLLHLGGGGGGGSSLITLACLACCIACIGFPFGEGVDHILVGFVRCVLGGLHWFLADTGCRV